MPWLGGWGWDVATAQFLITCSLGVLDLWVMYRVFWIPFVRNVAKEDRPYLFARMGREAKHEHEAADLERRVKGSS